MVWNIQNRAEAKQRPFLSALELELDLGNRARMRSGGDLAAIDGHFDFGTVLLDAADMAHDARLEYRP